MTPRKDPEAYNRRRRINRERRVDYYRPNWEAIVSDARRADGRWILAMRAAPVTVMRTIKQKRHQALVFGGGEIVARAVGKARKNGVEITDVYVRWVPTDYDPPAEALPDPFERTIFLPARVAHNLDTMCIKIDAFETELITGIITYLAETPVTYRPPKERKITVSIDDETWDRALQHVEEVGMSIPLMIAHELKKLMHDPK